MCMLHKFHPNIQKEVKGHSCLCDILEGEFKDPLIGPRENPSDSPVAVPPHASTGLDENTKPRREIERTDSALLEGAQATSTIQLPSWRSSHTRIGGGGLPLLEPWVTPPWPPKTT